MAIWLAGPWLEDRTRPGIARGAPSRQAQRAL
eukprot:COSAG01_NODE_22163_length_867_cov_2.765930_1_plen_31_part_10